MESRTTNSTSTSKPAHRRTNRSFQVSPSNHERLSQSLLDFFNRWSAPKAEMEAEVVHLRSVLRSGLRKLTWAICAGDPCWLMEAPCSPRRKRQLPLPAHGQWPTAGACAALCSCHVGFGPPLTSEHVSEPRCHARSFSCSCLLCCDCVLGTCSTTRWVRCGERRDPGHATPAATPRTPRGARPLASACFAAVRLLVVL